ncbi:cell division protein ZapA [Candidatus Poribacteria bacterium]|nr:cell division protein ZapA [Candidatus Poribacteria bacterium]
MNGQSKSIRVTIFGRDYNVKGGSDEEYIKKLAAHVDSVMRDIADKAGSLSATRVAILAALNIADEMYKEREESKKLTEKLMQELDEAMNPKS